MKWMKQEFDNTFSRGKGGSHDADTKLGGTVT